MATPGRLTLTVERLPAGGLRFTTTATPGWACVSHDPHAAVHCLQQAWQEHDIATYAAGRGEAYDQAHTADVDTTPVVPATFAEEARRIRARRRDTADGAHRLGIQRTDTYPCELWIPLPGGDWLSPSGRTYRAGTRTAQSVRRRRQAQGLPVSTVPDGHAEQAGARGA